MKVSRHDASSPIELGQLEGRSVFYKDKTWIGIAQVELVEIIDEMVRVTVRCEHPHHERGPKSRFIQCPVSGIRFRSDRVTLNAGYGINATLVFDPIVIGQLQGIRDRGASIQELLDAINFGVGFTRHAPRR